MNKREQLNTHYYSSVSDPGKWWEQAKRLMSSARLMREHALKYFSCTKEEKEEFEAHLNAYFMLAAFAIENALKALLVHKQKAGIKQQLTKRTKLPDILNTHDLLDLARRSDIPVLTAGDEQYLRRMTRYAIWAGRYPAPVSPDQIEVASSVMVADGWVLTKSYEEYDVKLCDILFAFIEKKWREI